MTSTVGERIRERRHLVGLSQRGLASAGVSETYISRVETGDRRPSAKALRALAPKLGVTAHWLETGEEDPAEELARLVLQHRGGLMTPRAIKLARRVLSSM